MSESFAVSIGLQKYEQPTITGVNYAHDDAKAMANVFEERLGVPSANIQVWLDDQATAAAWRMSWRIPSRTSGRTTSSISSTRATASGFRRAETA